MTRQNSLTLSDITRFRLYNQQISETKFKKPDEIVKWLGAVQGQDYSGAKWSIALRLPNVNDVEIEKAIADKKIIRTWPVRGTLHFVSADDIRWMLSLAASELILGNTTRDKQLGLDRKKYERSFTILNEALRGGKQLIREELIGVLKNGGIKADGIQLSHILQRAGLQQIICFGIRRGKQFTYTLLDEWIPENKTLSRDEALAELAKRYFISRGPATLQDFIWWSGLSSTNARNGLEMIKAKLVSKILDDKTYWMFEPKRTSGSSKGYLLPGFDEYLISYKDRSAIIEQKLFKQINAGGGILSPTVIINGKVAGTWKREFRKDKVIIKLKPFNSFTKTDRKAILEAAEGYSKFHDIAFEIISY